MIKNNLGRSIRKYRLEAGLSQEELASRCGVNFRTISSWECDRTEPNLKNIQDIAKACGVTEAVLVGRPQNTLIDGLIEMRYGHADDSLEEVNSMVVEVYRSSERDHLIEYLRKMVQLIRLKDDLGIQ